jgi:hypothetical protein
MFPTLVALTSPSPMPALSGRRATLLVASSATAGTPRTIPSVVGLWD